MQNEGQACASGSRSPKLAILVAGMHRSGTSAVTRLLSLLGCDLPKTLLPPNASNELGYWESRPVLTLNDEILAAFGSAWDDWQPFSDEWARSPTLDEFRERAQAVLADEFGVSRRFVLKDPRLCRLLAFWIEAVQAFGATPLVVCPIRNPLEVAASLEQRDGIAPSVGHLLWLCDVLEAEAASRPVTRVFVRYEDLLRDWRPVVDRLAEGFGSSWPGVSPSAEQAIDGFLTPSGRHHATTDTQVLEDATPSPWLRSSFEILSRWARGERRDTDTTELDRIREAFRQAAPTFTAPIVAWQQAARRARALEAKLREQEKRTHDLETTVARQATEMAQLQTRLTSAQARATALQHRLSVREHTINQMKHSFSWRLTRPLRIVYDAGFRSTNTLLTVMNGVMKVSRQVVPRWIRDRPSAQLQTPSKARYTAGDVNHLKSKLFELGFQRRALADLQHLATNRTHPQVQRLAAWELAVWHANQETHSDLEQGLRYLATAVAGEQNPVRLQQATVLAAHCYDALNRSDVGRINVQEALSQWQTADLFLAAANLEPTMDGRIYYINKALEKTGASPIAYETNAGRVPFTCLRPGKTSRSSPRQPRSPKVSVIMPAYNAEKTISVAIDSLLAQTWTNLEVLVVDDCSPDGTADVVKAYQTKDSRIQLLHTGDNYGPYVARNIGLMTASGHFVTCHDADDWSHPEKIERHVNDLLDSPNIVGNLSRFIRMSPTLKVFRRGNRGQYVDLNFSSVMVHRERVVSSLGFWDSVRFSADGELLWRITKVFGEDSVKELPHVLSFGGVSERSLTGHTFWGRPGYLMGARLEYRDAFLNYHNQADTLHYSFPQQKRPFAVPEVMKPGWRAGGETCRHFDVVLASDFRLPGGTTSSNIEEIRANQRLGLKTGLIQMYRYDMNPHHPIQPRVRRLLDDGAAQMLVYGERISCDLLIVRHPPVLQEWQQYLPEIKARATRVVVNQTPFRAYGPQGLPVYEIRSCAKHLREMLSTNGVWCPNSPLVRSIIYEHHSKALSAITLSKEDWYNIIDVNEWRRPTRPVRNGVIRIGRHSRDAAAKWPGDQDTLLACYPTSPEVEVRILGGAMTPRRILGELPHNWRVWEFGAMDSQEFLNGLDIYVYVTPKGSVEACPRTVLEAMAVGVPVILSPSFQPIFEEAALYATPDNVFRDVKRLMAEPALYERQVRVAMAFLEKHHSYTRHQERLERLLGPALTFASPGPNQAPGHVEESVTSLPPVAW